jgi:hypothetical protein
MQRPLAQYSLGNMGYSSTQCSIIPMGAGTNYYTFSVPIQCPFGSINTNQGEYLFGVNEKSLLPNNYCTQNEFNTPCSQYLDADYIQQQLLAMDTEEGIITLGYDAIW